MLRTSRARRSKKPSRPSIKRAHTFPSKRSAPQRKAARTHPRGRVSLGTGAGKPPDHIIVLVPGFMGSKLRDKTTGELVWLDFSQAGLNPLQWEPWLRNLAAKMRYPNDNLEPAGIIDDVLFLPPWVKQEQYSRLLRTLSSWGYRVDPNRYPEEKLNVYTFAYDWRQDNRISGRQLGQAVERWSALHPGAEVWLMGHSNGGIISRWYIEKEGGKGKVSRLILLASPWDGAAKAVYMLFQGMDVVFRRKFNLFGLPQHTREALRTFPSAYQLIPQSKSFLQDANGEMVNPFQADSWLPGTPCQALLDDGRRFNQELGNNVSVDTVAFFGRKLLTTSSGRVHYDSGRRWDHIEWQDAETGDGTVPEYSAVYASTDRNIPVVAEHGDIYVNPALYEILRWELVDKYKGLSAGRVEAVAGKFLITFNTDKDVYEPGEPMRLWATVNRQADGKPVSRARVQSRLVWRQPLPGSASSRRSRTAPPMDFVKDRETPGRWDATMTAPKTEGYYQVEAAVQLPSGAEVNVNQLIAVEAA